MTAPFAPQAPQQGRPTGPQGPYQGPPPSQQPFVSQQQAPFGQAAPQGTYWNVPSRAFVFSPLNWLAAILLPIGLLTVIIVTAVDDSYSKIGPVFALIGGFAVSLGSLALVGGLIVSALKKKD